MAKFTDLNLLSIGNTVQIAGAIYAGEGQMYLCMFPEHHGVFHGASSSPDCSDMFEDDQGEPFNPYILNMTREEWVQFLRQTDIMETEVLAQAGDDKKVVKAILRKSARQISQHISWAVYRRDGYACRYCGKDDVPLTVDHLVLWEKGGPSIEDNLVASCRKCNKTRGNTEYADWLKHPYYQKVSKALTSAQREANTALRATLDDIPRVVHKATKR